MHKPDQSPETKKPPELQPLSLGAFEDKEIIVLGRLIVGGLTREDDDDLGYELASLLLRFRAGLAELLQQDAQRGVDLICSAASSHHDLERTLAAECLTTVSTYDFELAVRLAVQMGADKGEGHEGSSEDALTALDNIEQEASPEQVAFIRSAERVADAWWYGSND